MNKSILVLTCACLFLAGCATMQTVKKGRGTGHQKVYPERMEVVWSQIGPAVVATGGKIAETSEGEHYLLASYGASAWSWGEKVAVFCASLNEGTAVEVVSKANLATNITAPDRAPGIFEQLDRALGQLRTQAGAEASQLSDSSPQPGASVQTRLIRLKQLRDDGTLTESEYAQKRKVILDGL